MSTSTMFMALELCASVFIWKIEAPKGPEADEPLNNVLYSFIRGAIKRKEYDSFPWFQTVHYWNIS